MTSVYKVVQKICNRLYAMNCVTKFLNSANRPTGAETSITFTFPVVSPVFCEDVLLGLVAVTPRLQTVMKGYEPWYWSLYKFLLYRHIPKGV